MMIDNAPCPICGGPVTNETWAGHFNLAKYAHEHVYKAFCESCQIMLERKIVGKEDTGWYSSSVDEADIIGELSQPDVDHVIQILTPYPTLLSQWEEFIAQKRETDIVCRFKEGGLPGTGLTIKRGSHLIGRFTIFGNI